MSVRRQTTSRPACRPSSSIVSARAPCVVERLHERTVADLHVEDDRVGAARDLLRHDRGRDQRQDVHRRGHIAKRVELLVRRHEIARSARRSRGRPSCTWAMNSSIESSTPKPGIDSSLSSVPPVWPRPRPLIFPTGTPHAATIGPTAIVVLSPTPPVECLSTTFRPSASPRSSVAAAADHRVGERVRLGGRHALEVHGHAERGQLVVGDLARAHSRGRAPRSPSAESSSPFRFARSARPGGSRLARHEDAVGRARAGTARPAPERARPDASESSARRRSRRIEPRIGEDDRAVRLAPVDLR